MNNHLKTILLLGALSALILAVGALIAPGHLGLFAALALATNLGAYFFSDRLVLRLHGAREVSAEEAPELHQMVEQLASQAGLPKPRVCLIPSAEPNAFATGRSPEKGVVAVTQGLLRLLDRGELRGVLAHELAHIKNRDILVSSIAAAAATIITSAAQALSLGQLFGAGSRGEEDDRPSAWASLLAIVVAPLAATLIQLGISRARELQADETGARISGDPEALARALLKLEQASADARTKEPAEAPTAATASLFIVNPLGAAESVSRWFSTHPSTSERVERLLLLAQRGGWPESLRSRRLIEDL